MIAEAFEDSMGGEAGRTIGLTGHPFLSMFVINLGDRPALLIDVQLPDGATVEDGQGFEILQTQRAGRTSVLIRPTRSGAATPAFVGLAEFVYRESATAASRSAATLALIDSVHEFRQFFARRNDRLGESAVRGLFAELELLIELVRVGIQPTDALLAWSGPYRGVDFRFADGAAIEVKSARVPARTVQISSEHQLNSSAGPLHLFVRPLATLAPEDPLGTKLTDLVTRAKSVATKGGGATHLWDSAMQAIGFDESDAHYAKWRFTSTDWQGYQVTEGFPRIISNELPLGVRGVTYALELEAAAPFTDEPVAVLEQIAAHYA